MLETIINFIFKVPFILDVIVVLFLLIITACGYSKGFWRASFRFIFVIILLIVSWIWIIDSLAVFINEQALTSFGIVMNVTGPQGTVAASGLKDIVESVALKGTSGTGNAPTAEYIEGLSLALSKSVAWLVIVIIIQFVSWIISAILYLIFRNIIPKKIRKRKLRLLGALLGLLQGAIVIICLMIPMSALSPAAERLTGDNRDPYGFVPGWAISIAKGLDPKNSMLNPALDWVKDLSNDLFTYKVGTATYDFRSEIVKFIDLTRGVTPIPPQPAPQVGYGEIINGFPHAFVEWAIS